MKQSQNVCAMGEISHTERKIGDASGYLRAYGEAVGYFMPWHHTTDPYLWLVAEILLKRTTRTAASRVFTNLVGAYPTVTVLAVANQEDIAKLH